MNKYLLLIAVLFAKGLSSPIKPEAAPTCQQVCHPIDPNKINVHLIPHSHDDVGWLKTVNQYYYGSHSEIQRAGVRYIISSTVEALKADPARRFVQVETAFFWRWWQSQTDDIKQDFIDLVNNGQLEIINGGWSMNDEATTNYQSTIDQFTYGLRTINDTIGICGTPKIGWQIDPFGHSREQASIYAQLGFDGIFFARIDYNDRDQRIADKNMEVIWKGSANLDNTNMFTNVFPEFYYPPEGYCFDIECGDEVLNDDEASSDYNIPRRVENFQTKMESLATYYQTNNVLIPMGGDFQYQSAEKNFINMDKLIAGFEGNERINLIYSTPSCYIKAVNDEATSNNIEFTLKTDDFFPYGSGQHSYWTGYFSSRPNAKRFERTANKILQVGKQLTSFSKVNGIDRESDLTLLKQAVGILQHHDAITGTAKEAVAKDYVRLLTKSIKTAEPSIAATVIDLLKKDPSSDINLNFETCLLANVSICEITKSDRFVVTVYNPLERPITYYVRLPVLDGTYKITGSNGDVIYDLVESFSFSYVNDSSGTPSPKELVFMVDEISGFGIRLYYVERTAAKSRSVTSSSSHKYGTETTGFEIDDYLGLLKSVTMNGLNVQVFQQFWYFGGVPGNNSGEENRASGAYILRPISTEATTTGDTVLVSSATIGNLVDEVHQEIFPWIKQIIRVYKGPNDNYIEFDWLVGPIVVTPATGIGREVITRYTVTENSFNSNATFYTDANGRELIKRKLNARYDYEYDWTLEPIASNYYPVTSKILIRDESRKIEMAVLTDRAQGGISYHNGDVELMVNRRLIRDDGKGVGEPLDDEEFGQGIVARGQHYLVLGSTDSNVEGGKSTAAQERELALKKLLNPLVLVADATSDDWSLENIQNILNFEFDGLKSTLPDNVHILTLEPWTEDSYILRLEHILEKGEDDTLSQSVTVDLTGLFTLFEITEIKETTLGANQWLEEFEAKEKFIWNIRGGDSNAKKSKSSLKAGEFEISLEPMQIRTFIIKVAKIK